MNKLEVIQTLCSPNGLSKAEATKIVSMFFEQMSAHMDISRVNDTHPYFYLVYLCTIMYLDT